MKSKCAGLIFKNLPEGTEHVQKRIELKNGCHFESPIFEDIQLCSLAQKDSSTPKVLKLPFVFVKHGSALISNVKCTRFDIVAEPYLKETKCNFRTFGVDESFWANEQSCISQKVGLLKWCPFFDSMLFWTGSAPSGGFLKKRTAHLDFIWIEEFSIHPRMYFKRF